MSAADHELMAEAMACAATARLRTSPNPWVGAVVVNGGSIVGRGATEAPGGRHAEVVALDDAGERANGSTVVVTLEPCSHHGRTPPCVDALIERGVRRVVVAIVDPDEQVAGEGIARLQAAGIEVAVGVQADAVAEQLAPYLHHRRTGRPYVICKLAASVDGRTGAPDGTSQWITGPAARADAHRLRAESDAVLVGAGTVRADDPALTVRSWSPPAGMAPRPPERPHPRRIVLGEAPRQAKVHPCLEYRGPLPELLDELGREGVLQLLVEGGASVASAFHRGGLVQRYVIYVAPVLFGGADAHPMFVGAGAASIDSVWRGHLVDIARLGDDVRLVLGPGTR